MVIRQDRQPPSRVWPWDLVILGLAVLYALAGQVGVRLLWGVNFAKFLPEWWLWASTVIVIAAALPPVASVLTTVMMSASDKLTSARRAVLVPVIVSVAFLPFFIFFHSSTPFLGDGALRINELLSGRWFLATEPGDFFLHAAFYRVLLKPLGLSAAPAYHLLSAVAGVIFLAGTYRLARYLSQRAFLTIWLALMASGLMVLFFGYVESYSIVAALWPYIFLSALKVIDRGRGEAVLLLLYVVSGIIHLASWWLFSGLVIGALVASRLAIPAALRRTVVVWAVFLVLGIVSLYLASSFGWNAPARHLLPLYSGIGPGLLSTDHLVNLINWFLIAGCPGIVLLAIRSRFAADSADTWSVRRHTLMFWAVLPALVFALVFVPKLGGPRDWDLFSLAFFVLVPASLTLICTTDRYLQVPSQLIAASLVGFCTMVSFAAVNASSVASANRFEEVIEVSPSGHLYQEYIMLHNFVEPRPDLSYRRLRYAQKAWEAPPLEHADSISILIRLSELCLEKNRLPEAREYIDLALAADSNNLVSNLLLVEHRLSQGVVAEFPDLAVMLESRFPDQPRALMEAGLLWVQSGDTERGGIDLRRAYTLDTSYALAALNYGIYLCQVEDYMEAAEILVGAAARHKAHPTMGNLIAVADSALRSAGPAATTAEAQARVRALRTRLDSLVSVNTAE